MVLFSEKPESWRRVIEAIVRVGFPSGSVTLELNKRFPGERKITGNDGGRLYLLLTETTQKKLNKKQNKNKQNQNKY